MIFQQWPQMTPDQKLPNTSKEPLTKFQQNLSIYKHREGFLAYSNNDPNET